MNTLTKMCIYSKGYCPKDDFATQISSDNNKDNSLKKKCSKHETDVVWTEIQEHFVKHRYRR